MWICVVQNVKHTFLSRVSQSFSYAQVAVITLSFGVRSVKDCSCANFMVLVKPLCRRLFKGGRRDGFHSVYAMLAKSFDRTSSTSKESRNPNVKASRDRFAEQVDSFRKASSKARVAGLEGGRV
jgi:hypothetical protein